jgi:transcriptional regulator with XRE-family HTH domain
MQQQYTRPDPEPGGEAQQPAISRIEAPGFDRREVDAGDAGGDGERVRAETLLLAQLADRAPEDAQVVLVGFAAGQEKLPNCAEDSCLRSVFPIVALSPAGGMRKAPVEMPRKRESTPRDPELAALGWAIEALMARGPNDTQTAVADASGLEVKQVGGYVRGQVSPSYRNLRRLCEGLCAKPTELMALVEAYEEAPATPPRPSKSRSARNSSRSVPAAEQATLRAQARSGREPVASWTRS